MRRLLHRAVGLGFGLAVLGRARAFELNRNAARRCFATGRPQYASSGGALTDPDLLRELAGCFFWEWLGSRSGAAGDDDQLIPGTRSTRSRVREWHT